MAVRGPPIGVPASRKNHRNSGSTAYKPATRARQEGVLCVKLAKRMAVALGSLLALAIAGGAHWRW